MKLEYSFPAVKGIQAKREYYISMVPIKLLTKLFPSEIDIVQPEYRAQRQINEQRIPIIKEYILNNRDNYVFSALSASIDGKFSFECKKGEDVGILKIDMDSTFMINDGQHRKAAIEAAINDDPSLAEETISIVFFRDDGLERSQQMFTDLNKHAIKSSKSLSTLYDSRDDIAVLTKDLIQKNSFFNKYTDKERDILGKNSSKLFTLNTIYNANQKILHTKNCSSADKKFIYKYWDLVIKNINEWKELTNGELSKKDLRENYVITLSVTFNSLGRLGRYFYDNDRTKMENALIKLKKVDWSRNNKQWLHRIIRDNGKIVNSEEASILACNLIKNILHIPLSQEERIKERMVAK